MYTGFYIKLCTKLCTKVISLFFILIVTNCYSKDYHQKNKTNNKCAKHSDLIYQVEKSKYHQDTKYHFQSRSITFSAAQIDPIINNTIESSIPIVFTYFHLIFLSCVIKIYSCVSTKSR